MKLLVHICTILFPTFLFLTCVGKEFSSIADAAPPPPPPPPPPSPIPAPAASPPQEPELHQSLESNAAFFPISNNNNSNSPIPTALDSTHKLDQTRKWKREVNLSKQERESKKSESSGKTRHAKHKSIFSQKIGATTTLYATPPEHCIFNKTHVFCNGTKDLEEMMEMFGRRLMYDEIVYLTIVDGVIPILNLYLLQPLIRLRSLSVLNCEVVQIIQSWPWPGRKNDNAFLNIEKVDFSGNQLVEVEALLEPVHLKSLTLSGNKLNCGFIWDRLAEWYLKNETGRVIEDSDYTVCVEIEDDPLSQHSLLGVIKAKKETMKICGEINPSICSCDILSLTKEVGQGYSFTHEGPRGNTAIALKMDCSNKNLTELPPIPIQTWDLSISHNFITDLSPLKLEMYQNLVIFDASFNQIEELNGILDTVILGKYNYLNLRNNQFKWIPNEFFENMKTMTGLGVTMIGNNCLKCDCFTLGHTKPLLLENQHIIPDVTEVYCEENLDLPVVRNMEFSDICPGDSENEEESSEKKYRFFIVLISLEILIGLGVTIKVWRYYYRRRAPLPDRRWITGSTLSLRRQRVAENIGAYLRKGGGGSGQQTPTQHERSSPIPQLEMGQFRETFKPIMEATSPMTLKWIKKGNSKTRSTFV